MNSLVRTLSEPTRVNEPHDDHQIQNSTGGYVYAADPWARLERFLILGTDGGTYYVAERELTLENAAVVRNCLDMDSARTLQAIASISIEGRAPKNSQALFALAMACAHSPLVRQSAVRHINHVARTGTHLYEFLTYCKLMNVSWSRAFKREIARRFEDHNLETLALHAVKYRQRAGWTWRDVLRLSHPKVSDPQRNAILSFMVDGIATDDAPDIIKAHVEANRPDADLSTVMEAISYDLPWESIPDSFRSHVGVMGHLAQGMGYMALLRNISKFARLGMLTPMGDFEQWLVERLADPERIKSSKIHPMQILDATVVHASGGTAGLSRGSAYVPSAAVLRALRSAFPLAFENVKPSGKRTLIALDISGSMWMGPCAGSAVLTPGDGALAMASITQAVEPQPHVVAFSSEVTPLQGVGVTELFNEVRSMRFGATNASAAIEYALAEGIEVDVFAIYTDSETNRGTNVQAALEGYRRATGNPDVALITVGMASNGFTLADPRDPRQFDVVGFDTNTPALISEFSAGNL